MLPLRIPRQARSGEEKKYVPTRPKKEEVCGGKGRIGWAGKCQLPEQKRQVYDTEKPSLMAEFNPTNPLEQGLGDRFFCPGRSQQTCRPNASYLWSHLQNCN